SRAREAGRSGAQVRGEPRQHFPAVTTTPDSAVGASFARNPGGGLRGPANCDGLSLHRAPLTRYLAPVRGITHSLLVASPPRSPPATNGSATATPVVFTSSSTSGFRSMRWEAPGFRRQRRWEALGYTCKH